jgi:hypothetical protein
MVTEGEFGKIFVKIDKYGEKYEEMPGENGLYTCILEARDFRA